MFLIVLNVGTEQRSVVDCRTEGCGKGAECIRELAVFVCRCPPGTAGDASVECRRGKFLNPYLFLHLIINTSCLYNVKIINHIGNHKCTKLHVQKHEYYYSRISNIAMVVVTTTYSVYISFINQH